MIIAEERMITVCWVCPPSVPSRYYMVWICGGAGMSHRWLRLEGYD